MQDLRQPFIVNEEVVKSYTYDSLVVTYKYVDRLGKEFIGKVQMGMGMGLLIEYHLEANQTKKTFDDDIENDITDDYKRAVDVWKKEYAKRNNHF